ncbi:MAG: sulfotransferase [Rhodocyclaceae bacterium]|nr:sulfotransferase [Rhodocyclaceae bacterium]
MLLHRDGRGVMHSHLKRGVNRDAALEAWRGYYARALPLLDKVVNPAHVLRVAYEDLVAEPEERLRRICRFLQLDFEPGMLDFSSKVHHTPEGNDMRHGSSKIRADDGWHTGMSAPDLAYFQRKAGDINRRLGYAERAGTTVAVGSLDLETARSL